ncbi:MAG TPA: hypothetical protein VGF28_11820 [Thermoanaerobaculia bacterium]|jgi:hypothetical protein
MSKEVTVDELREHLEEIIAEVQAGESVMIVREKTESRYTGTRFPFRGIDFGPRPKNLRSDPTDLIREDRDSEFRKHGL